MPGINNNNTLLINVILPQSICGTDSGLGAPGRATEVFHHSECPRIAHHGVSCFQPPTYNPTRIKPNCTC